MATLTAETNAILKLDLGGEGGIRRIPLAKLWDPATSRVSYQCLSNMALEFSDLADSKIERFRVTYTDEDGDNITISTDDELTDAFEQFITRVPPIVRAKASFQVENKKNGKKVANGLKQAVSEIGDTVRNGDGANQMQDVLDSFMTVLSQAVDSFSKNMDGVQQQKKRVGSRTFPSEVRARYRSHKSCCAAIKKRGITRNLRNKVIDEISSKAKADAAQVRARSRNHKACCSEIERRKIARNLQKKVVWTEGIDDVSFKTKLDQNSSSSSSSTPPPTPSPTRSHRGVTNVTHDQTITDEDVLLGRGGLTNMHRGNQSFKAFVEEVKPIYNTFTTKANKKEISLLLVEHIEQKGGRFSKKISSDSKDEWIVAERGEARKKACQALREKTAAVRKEDEEPKDSNVSTEFEKKQEEEAKDLNVSTGIKKKQEVPSDTFPVAKHSGEGFIHGRHTCDGCGVTPIIGMRFHALNLPDHDLCAKCAHKNSRKDIIFEPTELERDRYLQNKWKRQQLRLNNVVGGKCGGEMSSGNSPPFCSVDDVLAEAISRSLQDVEPKDEENNELKKEETLPKRDEEIVPVVVQIGKEECCNILKYYDGDDISYAVSTHESDDSDISDGEQDHDDNGCVDDALAEAIRRSLQDVKPETEEKAELKNMKTVSKRNEETVAVESPKLAEINNDKEEVEALMDEKDEEKVKAFCKEAKVEDKISVVESNLTRTESNTYDEDVSELQNTKPHKSFSDTNAKSVSISSLDVIPLPWPDTAPNHEHVNSKGGIHDCSSSSGSDSHHSDDDGTEDVEGKVDVSFIEDNDLDVSTNANDTVVCEMEQSVDTSEESSQSQSSADSWQILDENEQCSSDEKIAQAAQLLGSALFQSDTLSDATELKDERTITTDHNSISRTSFEASVPTIVPRKISPVVLSRWDTELKELHEIGFLDDEKNVNALAHLEAANMGVDSDDPVTVNGAVNYLLSKYSEIV